MPTEPTIQQRLMHVCFWLGYRPSRRHTLNSNERTHTHVVCGRFAGCGFRADSIHAPPAIPMMTILSYSIGRANLAMRWMEYPRAEWGIATLQPAQPLRWLVTMFPWPTFSNAARHNSAHLTLAFGRHIFTHASVSNIAFRSSGAQWDQGIGAMDKTYVSIEVISVSLQRLGLRS